MESATSAESDASALCVKRCCGPVCCERLRELLLLVATNAEPLFLAHINEPVVKPLVKG